MTDSPLARLFGLAVPTQNEMAEKHHLRADQETAELAAYAAKLDRRIIRISKWASQKNRAELDSLFGYVLMQLLEKIKTERIVQDTRGMLSKVHDLELKGQHMEAELHRGISLRLATRAMQAKEGHRRGADYTNEKKKTARQQSRELWDKLPEREKVRRGAVVKFAVATAPLVEGSTVDGIRRWVAEWRKEPSNR